MNLDLCFGLIYLFSSVLLISRWFKHYFMLLLMMEFFALVILFMMFNQFVELNMEKNIFVFIVMFVLEGTLGVTILMWLVYYSSNDYSKSLNLIMW